MKAAVAAASVFVVAVLGQAVLERTTTLPIAPARMLVVGLGLVAAMPVGVAVIEAVCRRPLPRGARPIVAAGMVPLTLAALLTAVRFSSGPFGPIPGGRLSGELVVDPTPDWSVLDSTKYVQLEMHGPRSVELVVVRVGRDAYVGANYPDQKVWPAIVAAHPDVRLRVGNRLYDRRAVRIADADESRRLLAAASSKYGFDLSLGTGIVRFFRLDPATSREER